MWRRWLCFLMSCSILLAACSEETTTKVKSEVGPPDVPEVEDVVAPPDLEELPPAEVEIDGDVHSHCVDADGDGFFVGDDCPLPLDCDDNDAAVYPGAEEICGNFKDDNCNGLVDEDCPCAPGEVRLCSSFVAVAQMTAEMHCKPGYQRCVSGQWESACHGEVGPVAEVCNGIDDNCDGQVDEGLRDALGRCDTGEPPPLELCGPTGEGNGLDDNGDGRIDEGCLPCMLPGGAPRLNQPCYSGPLHTLGVGVCRGGLMDCGSDGQWEACRGEVVPSEEICGDGLDNDCDGLIDESCPLCIATGPEVCDGVDNDCNGLIDEGVLNGCGDCGPVGLFEICNGLDSNCDGVVDEGCPCTEGAEQACYPGPHGKGGVGICQMGRQLCHEGAWGACEGFVLPGLELCGPTGLGNGLDDNCDGEVDEGCGCTPGETRPCGTSTGECESGVETCVARQWGPCEGGQGPRPEVCDGLDNDCNGLVDEGLLNACGACEGSCYQAVIEPGSEGLPDAGAELIPADDPRNPTGKPGLSLSQRTALPPYLWVSNHDYGSVSKIHTSTYQEVGRYWVGVQASRTAVDLDGNMWVGGRNDGRVTKVLWNTEQCVDRNGDTVITTSYRDGSGNVIQVNSQANPYADECVIYSEVMNPSRPSVRGVAVAPDGKVWIGYTAGGLQSIDPLTLAVGPFHAPDGVPLWLPDANDVYQETAQRVSAGGVYGLVVDSEGQLYQSSYTRQYLPRFDTNLEQWVAVYQRDGQCSYGVAVDGRNRVWTGGWPQCSGVTMFDPGERKMYTFAIPDTVVPNHHDTFTTLLLPRAAPRGPDRFYTTGVGVEPATGDVWTSFYPIGYTGRLRLDESDLANSQWTMIATTRNYATNAYLPGVSNGDLRGVGFDGNGFAWTHGLGSGRVWKIDPTTNERASTLPDGQAVGVGSHYTYSDFTGSTALSFTAPRGFWRYTYEFPYASVNVSALMWEAFVPAVTTAGVRLRKVDASGGALSEWYPPENAGVPSYYEYPPGELSHRIDFELLLGQVLQGNRFEVELRLTTSKRELRPIVNTIQLEWVRP